MKVSIGMNLTTSAWGGGNQFGIALTEKLKSCGIEVSFDLSAPDLDIILLADPRPELKITAYNHFDILNYLRQVNSRALVVHRINECDERKGERDNINPNLRQATQVADHTVFVSSWLRDLQLSQGMQPQNHSVILNGSDTTTFHPNKHQKWDKKSPLKLVTHHWGNHWFKGFDIYQLIDALIPHKNIEFTYIGKLPENFQFKNATYIEPKSGNALAQLLRQHHIYVTGSQFEPGSNHQNEGALCGLPLLYRESGSLPEYCTGFGVEFTTENFSQKLDEIIANYDFYADKITAYPHTSERATDAYLALFNELLEKRDEILAKRKWPAQVPFIQGDKKKAIDWLQSLREPILGYVKSLKRNDGKFAFASQGLTEAGENIQLAFSCWALKIHYMLGGWEQLPHAEKTTWVNFIQSFQAGGNPMRLPFARNAFLDPTLIKHVAWQRPRRERLLDRVFHPRKFTPLQKTISGETKQAVSTLAQVGAQANHPYTGFPSTPGALKKYLENLNWASPWEAGAHVATIAVYLSTEAPRFLKPAQVVLLRQLCNRWLEMLVHAETGAYFLGEIPNYGQTVNGAMKVLNALEWLEVPIHYPEKLIDTVLAQLPEKEGCHLVDAIYVLYRCALQTDYRKSDIQNYVVKVVDMMVKHYNPLDGGFSYYIGRSQPLYHLVRLTHQHPVSDLHGTVLLTWAAAMMLSLLEIENWHVMKA